MEKNSKNDFLDKFRKQRELLELQQKYESGLVLEEKMDETQKVELLSLYNEQISMLKRRIEEQKNKLRYYKKIIRKRLNQ